MRNTITLNGIESSTIPGLLIQSLPPISKPLMRTETEEIDGRDGDIITNLGFSAYDKQISVGLYGDFDINQVIAYFNSEGTVIFSNEPEQYYNYQIISQIDFERLVRYRTATINFHVQPFKYSTTEEAETIEAETVSGEGNNLVLENTSDAPFSKLTPKGDTFQQTYTGKNLFNPSSYDGLQANTDGTYKTTKYFTNANVVTLNLQPSTDYTLSIRQNGELDGTGISCAFNGEWKNTTSGYRTFTTDSTGVYTLQIGSNTYANIGNYNCVFQLESGSQATPYEPYVGGIQSPNPDYPQDIQVVTGEQTVKVVGKNLNGGYPNSFSITRSGVSFVSNTDGTISANGKATDTNALSMYMANATAAGWVRTYQPGTYTLSGGSENVNVLFTATDGSTSYSSNFTSDVTFTLTEPHTAYVRIQIRNGRTVNETARPQLELSSTATAYEPYQGQSYPISLGSTELCKIGTYQDYIWKDGSDWKIHKAIGKIVANGAEDITAHNTVNDILGVRVPVGEAVLHNTDVLSDNFYNTLFGTYYGSGGAIRTYGMTCTHNSSDNTFVYMSAPNSSITTADQFKTWFSAHNTTIYYVPVTATDTTITDATLIGQLEALNAAHAYKGRTHIISTAGSDANLPHIIEAEVLGSCDGTITNSGNTTARPKLTIFGSGNISIFLNGVQLFQVALGSEGHITIDTAAMEAYQDTTDNLKNRLVTGEYNNFVLNPGDNEISFSGSVTMCVVENYSRWL